MTAVECEQCFHRRKRINREAFLELELVVSQEFWWNVKMQFGGLLFGCPFAGVQLPSLPSHRAATRINRLIRRLRQGRGCQFKKDHWVVMIVIIELECEVGKLPWRRVDSVVDRLPYYGPTPPQS